MTTEQVENIALKAIEKVGISISRLVEFKPTMTTKEVLKYLDCNRHWLYDNKQMFGGKRANRRGDYRFDTEKVINYKIKN